VVIAAVAAMMAIAIIKPFIASSVYVVKYAE
jgi:hypothetical protein